MYNSQPIKSCLNMKFALREVFRKINIKFANFVYGLWW